MSRAVRHRTVAAALLPVLLLLPGCGGAAPTPPLASAPPVASPTAAPPARLEVTALGDSVTAGTSCGCTPFPQRYGAALQDRYGRPVGVADDGRAGDTSADLLDDLEHDTGEQRDVAGADVVLVTIGANDLVDREDAVTSGRCRVDGADLGCAAPELDRLRRTLGAVLARVRVLRRGAPTAVLVTGYWNVFEDGDVASQRFSAAGRAATDQLTRQADDAIRAATLDAGSTYVDLYEPFEGGGGKEDPTPLLAADGDHPNARGHQVITDALLAAGTAPLVLGARR